MFNNVRNCPNKADVKKWFEEKKVVYHIYISHFSDKIIEYHIVDISNLFKGKMRPTGYVACEEANTSIQYWIYYKDLFVQYEDAIKYLVTKNLYGLKKATKNFDKGYKQLLKYLDKSKKYYLKKALKIQYPEIGVKNEIT